MNVHPLPLPRHRNVHPTITPLDEGIEEWEQKTPVEATTLQRLIRESVREAVEQQRQVTLAWSVAIAALLALCAALIR